MLFLMLLSSLSLSLLEVDSQQNRKENNYEIIAKKIPECKNGLPAMPFALIAISFDRRTDDCEPDIRAFSGLRE